MGQLEGSEGQLERFEGQPEECEGQPTGFEGQPIGFEGQPGGGGQVGGDKQTKFLSILKDLVPFLGRCLKNTE